MRPAYAVIPTIFEAPQLPTTVDRLLEEGVEQVILIANKPASPPEPTWRLGESVSLLRHSGTIYDSWNIGIGLARDAHRLAVVLNDDAVPEAGATWKVLRCFDLGFAVVGYDYLHHDRLTTLPVRRTSGSYRHGGVGGFAFACDPHKVRPVDSRFEWWYGDDDMFFQAEEDGHELAVALGAGVTHAAETTARNHAWTIGARARDAERFREKWGDR